MPIIGRYGFTFCAAIALACALAAPAGAELLVHKDLSLDTANAMAEGAIAACKERGYATSAVVVDRDGETIVSMRGDRTGPHTVENARRKAYTAMTFKQTTSEYAKKWNDGSPVVKAQVTLPSIIANPGGVPIKVGDEVIAGIGVSGSPGFDEDCINASLDKIKDQLK